MNYIKKESQHTRDSPEVRLELQFANEFHPLPAEASAALVLSIVTS